MIAFDRKIGGIDHFRHMADFMGHKATCDLLQIHRTTLDRILAGKTKLPHSYLIALYWETPWGRSVVDCHNVTLQRLLYSQLDTKEKIISQLEKSIEELIYQSSFDSANIPVYKIKG